MLLHTPTHTHKYPILNTCTIYSTELYDHEAAVIVNNISDHQMICTYSTTTVKTLTSLKKHIEVEKNDHQALENFLNELKNSNIVDKLSVDANADPNLNFDRFMEHFMKLKEQHLPKKVVRFDRKKHKINPWLTAGILKSINSKDKLYKTLLQTPKEIVKKENVIFQKNLN